MKAIKNKFSLIVIALLVTNMISASIIFKYCVVHSWSPKGPEGDYNNPYSNFVISLATIDDPENFQQPDISEFETQNENYLYAQKHELTIGNASAGSVESTYKGDVSNKMLGNFCPTEYGNTVPQFISPFVYWIVEGFCDNDYNQILYPQKRFIAHFAFFKTEFNAYQKYVHLTAKSNKYYLIGWSGDGQIKQDILHHTGDQVVAFKNYGLDADAGSTICGGA